MARMWKVCGVSKRFILIDNNQGIAVIKSCKELGSNRNRIWNWWSCGEGENQSHWRKTFHSMNENQQQTEPINSVACEFWTQKTGYNKRPQSFLGSFTFIVPPTDPLTLSDHQFLSRFEHGQLVLYWQYEHPGSDEILYVTLVRLFSRKMSLVPPPLSIRCLSRSTSSSSFCTGLSDTLTRLAKWEWNV